ncbi:L,D-transpeptidase family protein [Sphingomicrobium nitratireducens]|uniref:L,D-transpeptidase family protein n=1 Tax=Sphingomicrobium nitratireducens TaxID=2964666 RepID=UPI0022409480|nr:L,D-transpeptidase family protein [Sphingomicrobium nitratireducens]
MMTIGKFSTMALAALAPMTAAAAQQAMPAQAPTSLPSMAPAVAPAIDWTSDEDGQRAADRLIALLEHADLEGFAAGPTMAVQARALLDKAKLGVEADRKAADRFLTDAFAGYMDVLNAPVYGVEYGDNWARPSRLSSGVLLKNALAVPSLEAFVTRQASINPVYDRLRHAASALPANDPARTKVASSLERVRAFPTRTKFVLVDSATQRLWMFENGEVVDSMKVVVGKQEYATPMIASTIYYGTFNPYWHVPYHLIRNTIAPNVRRQGVGYLKARGYEVVDRWAADATIVDPKSVDWAAAAKTGDLKVRQLPGGANSMGNMKFDFANSEGIYLHDTPMKEYFKRDVRALSNGCIRLEDAARFGRWLFQGQALPATGGREQHVLIPEPVPVYVTYLTANAIEGQLAYADDIYGLDKAMLARNVPTAEPQSAGAVATATSAAPAS